MRTTPLCFRGDTINRVFFWGGRYACHNWEDINFIIILLFHDPNVSCLNRMKFRYSKLVCKRRSALAWRTPINEWFRPHTVYCLLQLAKLSLSDDFFRWEKLHFVNEISPWANADSHEFYCLCCWIFYIDVESILNVLDVSIACRNENYRSVLSSTHRLSLVAASENIAQWWFFRREKLLVAAWRKETVLPPWLQLAKLLFSCDFFRWEKLRFVNEIPPQTNADSHEFYCLCCCIFHIDVESILNVFDVSIACRNENYRSVLSVRVCVVQTVAVWGHVYAVRWCFAYAEIHCHRVSWAPPVLMFSALKKVRITHGTLRQFWGTVVQKENNFSKY